MLTLSVLPILAISEKLARASGSRLLSAFKKIMSVHSATLELFGVSEHQPLAIKQQLTTAAAVMIFIAGFQIAIVLIVSVTASVSRWPRAEAHCASLALAWRVAAKRNPRCGVG